MSVSEEYASVEIDTILPILVLPPPHLADHTGPFWRCLLRP